MEVIIAVDKWVDCTKEYEEPVGTPVLEEDNVYAIMQHVP